MADFVANPTVIKTHALFDLVQEGGTIRVVAKSSRVGRCGMSAFLLREIKANPVHMYRSLVADLEARGGVAFLECVIDGKAAQLMLTAAEWDAGAKERARFAAWADACALSTQARIVAERAFDRAHNEGGEGYNPHRSGAAQTYRGR